MKVFYDYQIFEAQKFGGISRYFYELLKRNHNHILPIKYSRNEYLKYDNRYSSQLQPIPRKGKFKFLPKKQSNQDLTRDTFQEGAFDLFHPTYFDPYFLDCIGEKPYVLTIHDMINELFPECFSLDEDLIFYKKELILNANRIIAVSNTTKRDLLRFYPEVRDRVDVVYHGCSLEVSSSQSIKLPENYLLFVGNRSIYKNFYFLLNAIQSIIHEHKDLYLVCTGSSFNEMEYHFIEQLELRDKVLHYFSDDSNLFSFYKNAKAFIFPSMYEGFGIPILEAFKAECPVVLSRIDPFLEVAGDSAQYFESKDPESLRNCINEILKNDDLRKDLISKGLVEGKKFSWDITHSQTLEVYKKSI